MLGQQIYVLLQKGSSKATVTGFPMVENFLPDIPTGCAPMPFAISKTWAVVKIMVPFWVPEILRAVL